MIATLNSLKGILKDYPWAIFGSIAIMIHNNGEHRDLSSSDIDIIVEGDIGKIRKKIEDDFKRNRIDLLIRTRNGRWRGCAKINGMDIEMMFTVGEKSIDLADGNFKFNKIETKTFKNEAYPVVDIQSLFNSKKRHLKSINKTLVADPTNVKMKKKRENIMEDIDVIDKILLK